MQIAAAAAAAPETTTTVGGHWHRESGECEREFRNAINLVAVCHGKAAHATAKHSEDCGALRCRFRGKAMDPLVAEETSSKWRMERKKGTINCTRRLQCSSFSAVQREVWFESAVRAIPHCSGTPVVSFEWTTAAF